jgi:hypothetical protein
MLPLNSSSILQRLNAPTRIAVYVQIPNESERQHKQALTSHNPSCLDVYLCFYQEDRLKFLHGHPAQTTSYMGPFTRSPAGKHCNPLRLCSYHSVRSCTTMASLNRVSGMSQTESGIWSHIRFIGDNFSVVAEPQTRRLSYPIGWIYCDKAVGRRRRQR